MPDRYDYDRDDYYYDEDSDQLCPYDEGGTRYTGDGEELDD